MWKIAGKAFVAIITSIAAVSSARAGVIFVPVGNVYIDPERTTVLIGGRDPNALEIRSAGLQGEWIINRTDVLPELVATANGEIRLPVKQSLSLVLNLSLGTVEGRSRGKILAGDVVATSFQFVADVRGTVSCLPFNGLPCGQLILDMDLRGGLGETHDPASAGQVRSQIVGSLIRESRSATWQALDANTTIGANPALIHSLVGAALTAEEN